MDIQPLRDDLRVYIAKHNLTRSWAKAARLFTENLRHPSLHVELLEPRWRGIYSFRIDRKYRALFFLSADSAAEVFQITNHYKK